MGDHLKQWETINEKNTRLCLHVCARLNAAMVVSGAKEHDYPSFLITCKLARQSCHMFCTALSIVSTADISSDIMHLYSFPCLFPFYQHNRWALAIQNTNPPSGSFVDIWLQGRLRIGMCTQTWEMSSAASLGNAKFACAISLLSAVMLTLCSSKR